MTFTIDTDMNICVHAEAPSTRDDVIRFSTQAQFDAATANWQTAQYVQLWNAYVGCPPFGELRHVKKFENRAIAIKRIWATIQKLAGNPAPAAETAISAGAPEAILPQETDEMPKSTTKANARAQKPAKARRSTVLAQTTTPARTGTRKELVLGLIKRKGGATLQEIMKATSWQPHSVRGFIATLGTKHGVQISSTKNEAGERVYQATV